MRAVVGTDLVHIPRIALSLERTEGFAARAFTPGEQSVCRGDPARLAGRWAVKESVLKSLALGIGSVPMTDIEVLAHESGAPVLSLSGAAARAAEAAGVTAWSVSISHDGQYATAVVVGTVP